SGCWVGVAYLEPSATKTLRDASPTLLVLLLKLGGSFQKPGSTFTPAVSPTPPCPLACTRKPIGTQYEIVRPIGKVGPPLAVYGMPRMSLDGQRNCPASFNC